MNNRRWLCVMACMVGIIGCTHDDDRMLNAIWTAYSQHPGNVGQGLRWLHVKGEMIQKGTVPPSALNSESDQRLPAYLACYTFTLVLEGAGDGPADMCIYYVDNPLADTHGVLWRDRAYLSDLQSKMRSDGFSAQ